MRSYGNGDASLYCLAQSRDIFSIGGPVFFQEDIFRQHGKERQADTPGFPPDFIEAHGIDIEFFGAAESQNAAWLQEGEPGSHVRSLNHSQIGRRESESARGRQSVFQENGNVPA